MRAKTGRRSTRALVVSGVLAALACGARAQAQETITTNDGGTLPNVKVERVEGDSALLLVPMTDLSPESRKRLGLRTHEEQAAFEARLSALASDWREIHSDPNFLSWLKEHDDAYPTDRAALMTKAMREGDATQVAKLMYTWKAIRAAVEQERVDREAVEAKVRRDRLWADAHPWWTQENYRRMAALAEERGWALDRFKEAILTFAERKGRRRRDGGSRIPRARGPRRTAQMADGRRRGAPGILQRHRAPEEAGSARPARRTVAQ
jgi:hypothetical protein